MNKIHLGKCLQALFLSIFKISAENLQIPPTVCFRSIDEASIHIIRQLIKSKIYIKLEGVKFRFPLTWFKCAMARSYAVCTDLRTLGFLPSIKRNLSTVSSIPSCSSLLRGSHCLKTKRDNFQRDPDDSRLF